MSFQEEFWTDFCRLSSSKSSKVGPAPKRLHVLFSSRQQTSTQSQPVFNLFVLCASAIYLATSLETPQNTNNRMLIVRKIIVLFSIALIKFIHSFDVDIDIEQSKPLVRTFYAETRCALLISGISKTHEKELLKTCFISISCKKKPSFTSTVIFVQFCIIILTMGTKRTFWTFDASTFGFWLLM